MLFLPNFLQKVDVVSIKFLAESGYYFYQISCRKSMLFLPNFLQKVDVISVEFPVENILQKKWLSAKKNYRLSGKILAPPTHKNNREPWPGAIAPIPVGAPPLKTYLLIQSKFEVVYKTTPSFIRLQELVKQQNIQSALLGNCQGQNNKFLLRNLFLIGQ
jgi:hypothetical protein